MAFIEGPEVINKQQNKRLGGSAEGADCKLVWSQSEGGVTAVMAERVTLCISAPAADIYYAEGVTGGKAKGMLELSTGYMALKTL